MRWIAGGVLALFLLQCAHGLARKSGTCDELGAHLPAGVLYWKSGEFSGGLANPPLGQLLVAAGPVLAGTADHPLRDSPRWLLPARLPVVLLGAFVVLLVGAMARRAAGPVAGIAALAAAALSPNLVAHSRLATLDLPATAFFALACWAAWSWHRTRQPVALLAWTFAAGAACLIKHSALHLLPAVALGALAAGNGIRRGLRDAAVLTAAGAAGTAALAWLSYGGGESVALLPAAYVDALRDKWIHGRTGHFAYLLGRRSPTGFPHYFVVALLVKVPLAILLAGGAGAAAIARRRVPGDIRGFLAFVVIPGVWILLAMSLLHRVDIGLRHVLPFFPALLAVAGIGWARLWGGRRRSRALALGLAAWALVAAARITPDHLEYFHELVGGPGRGDRILIDSNLDWGQDEGEMRAWAGDRGVLVNPTAPTTGIVAANINAIHGILSQDDRRLRWTEVFDPIRTFGYTWRVFDVREDTLREAAARSPLRALDYARFLLASGRPREAGDLLRRNDLSAHAKLAREWWQLKGEAFLAAGDLAAAAEAAPRSGDADLAAEVSFRLSEERGTPWLFRTAQERSRIFGALMRRGKRDDARRLAERVRREHPDHEFPEFARITGPPPASATERVARAVTWKRLGNEAAALRDVAVALAEDPGSEDALWLYGELVVRRKLGLAEYTLPDVDWSRISRASGTSRP